MSGEVAVREDRGEMAPLVGDEEIRGLWRVAEALAKSGLFPDARTGQEAFAKVLYGRDLGLTPTEAMTNIYIIDGAPSLAANLMASRVKKSEKYDYRVRELDNTHCVIDFYEHTEEGKELIGTSVYGQEDVKMAGLDAKTRNGKDPNHVKFPRNMKYARAMSNGVAWYCPDVMGGLRVYVPEDTRGMPGGVPLTDGGEAAALPAPAYEDVGAHLKALIPYASQEVRDALATAIERVRQAELGSWPDSKVEMALSGRAPGALEEMVTQIEAEADAAEKAEGEAKAAWESSRPADAEPDADADPDAPSQPELDSDQ